MFRTITFYGQPAKEPNCASQMAMPFINCGDIITNGRPKTNHVRCALPPRARSAAFLFSDPALDTACHSGYPGGMWHLTWLMLCMSFPLCDQTTCSTSAK